MYFSGPKAMLCGSLGDLLTNETVVPAFTCSSFGKKPRIVVLAPTPAKTVFAGVFAAASTFDLAQAASVSTLVRPATSFAVCTGAPLPFTATVIFMPG